MLNVVPKPLVTDEKVTLGIFEQVTTFVAGVQGGVSCFSCTLIWIVSLSEVLQSVLPLLQETTPVCDTLILSIVKVLLWLISVVRGTFH